MENKEGGKEKPTKTERKQREQKSLSFSGISLSFVLNVLHIFIKRRKWNAFLLCETNVKENDEGKRKGGKLKNCIVCVVPQVFFVCRICCKGKVFLMAFLSKVKKTFTIISRDPLKINAESPNSSMWSMF